LVFFTAQPFDPADSPRKLHHFIFHIRWISVLRFLYFNVF